METRLFGNTGDRLSLLGFGCMRLPLAPADGAPDPSRIDEALATAMIRKAVDRGVTYLDTAWPYHGSGGFHEPGASEPLVGRALRDGYRNKVKLATKLPTWAVKGHADMERILTAQLRRLETAHIDYYLAHNLNSTSWPAMRELRMLDFLEEAKKAGRIRHIGFSFHDRFAVFEEILGAYDWDFTQIQYNYLDQHYQAGRRGLKLAKQRGLGIVIMEPLRGGFLVNQMPQEMRVVLAAVRPEWSLADWALRWLWNHPEIHVVLSGMSSMAQTDENLKIADEAKADTLTAADLDALDHVRRYFTGRLKVHCTACGYCLPCPAGVNIPKNFMNYNDYHLTDDQKLRAFLKVIYSTQVPADERADRCIHCKECETKCPQTLPIDATMGEVAATFRS